MFTLAPHSDARPHAPRNVAGQTFFYDANGNMTRGLGGKQITYDAQNRPVSVSRPGGYGATYGYGPDGTRIWKESQGKRTRCLGSEMEIQPWGLTAAPPGTGGPALPPAHQREPILTLFPHADVRLP